jgi:hypothetical protein
MLQYVQALRKESGFEVIGKSSVGLIDQPAGSLLSVPEYTKSGLFEVSDALIIDRSSMVSFEALKDSIKNCKHLYLADFPDISAPQCQELNKLVQEAGNIVQIRNPLMEDPAARWVAVNWHEPAYLNYSEGYSNAEDKRNILIKILLYAHTLFTDSPQKIRVSGVTSQDGTGSFLNIRLDYATFSAINFEILQQPGNEIRIKAALPGQFIETTGSQQVMVNHRKTIAEPVAETSFAQFIHNIKIMQHKSGTGLQTLSHVLSTYSELLRKITLYSSWTL